MGFASEQLERLSPLWQHMLRHRFLQETRDGKISDEVFANWMRQDYLFVEAAIPFMGVLMGRAPASHRKPLADAIGALFKELELFEERGREAGVDLRGAPPSFICHAYVRFLMATAAHASYVEGYTVLYTAERAYHDSWKVVQQGLSPESKWYPFVENWAGDAFAGYVDYLEHELDMMAEAAGPAERKRMVELFEITTRYEIAFWEMAYEGLEWPGMEDFRGGN